MRAFLRWVGVREDTKRAPRRRVPTLDGMDILEGRRLLSSAHAAAEHGGSSGHGHDGDVHGNGEVRKDPHFYELYQGPKRADLNVVAASARFKENQGLVLRGEMAGKINATPATADDNSFFVFGINRGSALAATNAPFANRPNIKFDALVIVTVSNTTGVTASVRDLVTGVGTNLSPDAVKITGRHIQVTVDPALLPVPAGGKPTSEWTFNLWPRSSTTVVPPGTTNIASFIPENAMAPIAGPGGHGHHH